jgi:hypothetical protein
MPTLHCKTWPHVLYGPMSCICLWNGQGAVADSKRLPAGRRPGNLTNHDVQVIKGVPKHG